MSSTLGGKVAILYGGGPISAGVVDAFAREGAHVILAGRNADKIRAIEVEQKSRGYSIDTVVLNAMDPELTNTFVGDVAERLAESTFHST